MLALVLSGILVTTQNGAELGRESWRDDGKVVTSDVTVMGQKATISIDRKKRNLHIEPAGQPAADVAIGRNWGPPRPLTIGPSTVITANVGLDRRPGTDGTGGVSRDRAVPA